MDYTIPAIPTVYRGRRYRSRLEARWAAFFTLIGIEHEYEPYGLGVWLPDFVLGDRSLVEIKPLPPGMRDRETTEKMERAVETLATGDKPRALLFLGCGVRRDGVVGQMLRPDRLDRWKSATICWVRDESSPRMEPRFATAGPFYSNLVAEYPRHMREKWIAAAAAVRTEVQP